MSQTDEWKASVDRGRRLVAAIGDSKWELGDLANEVCASSGTTNGHDDRLARFADEIGINVNTLRGYRAVAAAWPLDARASSQTWTTHARLGTRDDRFDIIAEQTWTYNSLSERLGRLPNPSRETQRLQPAQPEFHPEVSAPVAISHALASEAATRTLIESKEARRLVRAAIKANPEIATEAMKALDERYEEAPKPINKPTPADQPVELVYEFRQLHRSVDRIILLVIEGKAIVSDTERDAVLREVQWLRTALGYVEDGVKTDALADELAEMLRAQS